MKKYILYLVFRISVPLVAQDASKLDYCSTTVAFLQAIHPETITMDNVVYEIWLKPIKKDTLFPRIRVESGTAFFVGDSLHLFLVTASHVASKMTITSTITLKTLDDHPITFSFSQFVATNELLWVINKDADVAVLELEPQQEVWPHLKKHFIPISGLEDKLQAPSRDISLVTIGFPLGLGIQERFSPISRESKPASGLIILQRFDTKAPATFYLLDSPSVGGFSGAPLFHFTVAQLIKGNLTLGGPTICLGLIHGTISDETGGKFAAVVPSHFIVETIQEAIRVSK